MSDEIFDVVDDRDRVIGRQSRREVHRLGLKHRAVHVLVFNSRGELFLQKRSFKKDTFPGAWDSSASGHLDSGETYDACAVREVREEIGLFLDRTPKRLFKIDACAQTGLEFVWVYRCESAGPFRLNLEELECGAFFKPDHINRWMAERPRDFADSFRLVWKYVLNPPEPKPKPAPRPAKIVAPIKPVLPARPVAPRPVAPRPAAPAKASTAAKVARPKPVTARPGRRARPAKPTKPAKPARPVKPAKAKAAAKRPVRKAPVKARKSKRR